MKTTSSMHYSDEFEAIMSMTNEVQTKTGMILVGETDSSGQEWLSLRPRGGEPVAITLCTDSFPYDLDRLRDSWAHLIFHVAPEGWH